MQNQIRIADPTLITHSRVSITSSDQLLVDQWLIFWKR